MSTTDDQIAALPSQTAEPLELRIPREALTVPPSDTTVLAHEGEIVVDVTPTDEVYREWVGPERYTATVRGWSYGQTSAAADTPAAAVRALLRGKTVQ